VRVRLPGRVQPPKCLLVATAFPIPQPLPVSEVNQYRIESPATRTSYTCSEALPTISFQHFSISASQRFSVSAFNPARISAFQYFSFSGAKLSRPAKASPRHFLRKGPSGEKSAKACLCGASRARFTRGPALKLSSEWGEGGPSGGASSQASSTVPGQISLPPASATPWRARAAA